MQLVQLRASVDLMWICPCRMYFKVKPDSYLTWTLIEQSTDETGTTSLAICMCMIVLYRTIIILLLLLLF